jgi:hypothetical protein
MSIFLYIVMFLSTCSLSQLLGMMAASESGLRGGRDRVDRRVRAVTAMNTRQSLSRRDHVVYRFTARSCAKRAYNVCCSQLTAP